LQLTNSPEKAQRLFSTTNRSPSVSRNTFHTRALVLPPVVPKFVTSHSERKYEQLKRRKIFLATLLEKNPRRESTFTWRAQ
jgi:hypothetical protein